MTKDIKNLKDLLKLYKDTKNARDLNDYELGIYHTLESIIEYKDNKQFLKDFIENCVKNLLKIKKKNNDKQDKNI